MDGTPRSAKAKSRGIGTRASIVVAGLAVAIASFASPACAPDRGGLTERELAAAKEWKPTRWAEGKRTALVVMDMQKANMPIVDQERVVAAIRRLVAAADAAGSPVVWVYSNDEDSRPGEDRFELAPPFAPGPGHLKLVKAGTSAISGTSLGPTLEGLGVGRLVICGVSSNECVKSTVESSYFDGWLTVVARDAHSMPSRSGSAETVANMNTRWAADRRVRLLDSRAIRFD
ncbi:MAG: isochorismatase family protein [Spirochaetes bacterium]|nr:isochorismatase family protein [Spirochaetota bacterium]MBU1079986.1 isochorismatase family protein [Spirochaetota bacterium]